jgi:hypothetical protein
MEKDVLDNFTVATKAADAVEKADPKIQAAGQEPDLPDPGVGR